MSALPIPLDALALLLALLLDLALGEPPNRLHPTVWMGRTVALAERIAPGQLSPPALQLIFGAGMALLIPAFWGALAWAVTFGLLQLHPLAYLVVVGRAVENHVLCADAASRRRRHRAHFVVGRHKPRRGGRCRLSSAVTRRS